MHVKLLVTLINICPSNAEKLCTIKYPELNKFSKAAELTTYRTFCSRNLSSSIVNTIHLHHTHTLKSIPLSTREFTVLKI